MKWQNRASEGSTWILKDLSTSFNSLISDFLELEVFVGGGDHHLTSIHQEKCYLLDQLDQQYFAEIIAHLRSFGLSPGFQKEAQRGDMPCLR